MALLCSLTACYHREANVVLVPVPIQLNGDRVEGAGVPMLPARWHRVEAGMNKDDVIHFVGEPTRREYDGNFTTGNVETWFYESYDMHDGHFDPHKVRFQDGRVISMSFDQARYDEKLREKSLAKRKKIEGEVIPADVGFACDNDEQCFSRHCADHKCTGPNGCTRGIGASCLADSDCCSRHCDMGGFVCL